MICISGCKVTHNFLFRQNYLSRKGQKAGFWGFGSEVRNAITNCHNLSQTIIRERKKPFRRNALILTIVQSRQKGHKTKSVKQKKQQRKENKK
jgi:hypothetical protein